MNTHSGTCANCNHQITVTASQIAMYGVRWICPSCGYVIDLSQKQLARPGLSAEAKQFWGVVGVGAFVIGLIKLFDHFS